ncbi:MAG TPA: hypothetical protein VM901_06800 [Bdellovibrionota bacterium]|jgi:hypothetical protein|nr:hypothetical protein [Bdellovibrionota bacterium]
MKFKVATLALVTMALAAPAAQAFKLTIPVKIEFYQVSAKLTNVDAGIAKVNEKSVDNAKILNLWFEMPERGVVPNLWALTDRNYSQAGSETGVKLDHGKIYFSGLTAQEHDHEALTAVSILARYGMLESIQVRLEEPSDNRVSLVLVTLKNGTIIEKNALKIFIQKKFVVITDGDAGSGWTWEAGVRLDALGMIFTNDEATAVRARFRELSAGHNIKDPDHEYMSFQGVINMLNSKPLKKKK